MPKSLADRIERVSATEFHLDRAAVDLIMSDYARLMRGTRIRPTQERGQHAGIRLDNVTPMSLVAKLGIQNGDQLRSINGFQMTSPESGRKLTIDYRIR